MSPFLWLDTHEQKPLGRLGKHVLPIIICVSQFFVFVGLTALFILFLINPHTSQNILLQFHPADIFIGFVLYFVTAVDYALIVGRMQAANRGSKARVIMNVATCWGCFVGVTLVLFLWSYLQEVPLLNMILLFFAGAVMIKIAAENQSYFENAKSIPPLIRKAFCQILNFLHHLTHPFTFWIPELGTPKTKKLHARQLAQWAFLLPFIIGLDDLVGYMGAMTFTNVFSLLIGIYIADILIDILIFFSPKLTKRIVENPTLSFAAAIVFLYLAYRSYAEVIQIALIHLSRLL